MSFIVYRALCSKTGKAYIGCTRKGMKARRTEHYINASVGVPGKFYHAIRQHGEGAFTWSVLATYSSEGAMFLGERAMIAQHHTATMGYNTTSGGHNGHLTPIDRYFMAKGAHSARRTAGVPPCLSRSRR